MHQQLRYSIIKCSPSVSPSSQSLGDWWTNVLLIFSAAGLIHICATSVLPRNTSATRNKMLHPWVTRIFKTRKTSTFQCHLCSGHWASNKIADSFMLATIYGPPTFFVTFTCNGERLKIKSHFQCRQVFTEIPVIVCWVFKQKVLCFMSIIHTMFPNAGFLPHSIQYIGF